MAIAREAERPLWVISGHSTCRLGMSAFGPKADLGAADPISWRYPFNEGYPLM